jgi:hypothetical protein
MEMNRIEVNLGVGMNMFFAEPVKIIIDNTFEKRYKKYLKFVKTLEDVDYDYITDDPNEHKLREFTFEEFVETWENNKTLQKKFK